MRLVAGGTDNHMVLVNLEGTGVTGLEAEEALGRVGIVINRNAVPFDTHPPRITGGIRLGAPAVTARGFGTDEMKRIGDMIVRIIRNINDDAISCEVAKEAAEICGLFPLPGVDN